MNKDIQHIEHGIETRNSISYKHNGMWVSRSGEAKLLPTAIHCLLYFTFTLF